MLLKPILVTCIRSMLCIILQVGVSIIQLVRKLCQPQYDYDRPLYRSDYMHDLMCLEVQQIFFAQADTPHIGPEPVRCEVCFTNEIWFFPDCQDICFSLKRAYCRTGMRCRYPHLEDRSVSSRFVRLARFMEFAKSEICLCMFSLTSLNLVRILIDLKKRGVDIKVITDANQRRENEDKDQTSALIDIGIQVKEYGSPQDPSVSVPPSNHCMHHKFIIIDRRILITGSFNWSHSAAFHNYELLFKTHQRELVRQCLVEFDKMWFVNRGIIQILFEHALALPEHYIKSKDQCDVCESNEIWFFPENISLCHSLKREYCKKSLSCRHPHLEDNPRSNFVRLVRTIEAARQEIHLCMYNLTSMSLIRVLCDLKRSGVDIYIITDANQRRKNNNRDLFMALMKVGILVKEYHIVQDPSASAASNHHCMHHKFIIIDRKLLLTGSFNWSHSAAFRNHELLIKTGQPGLVSRCLYEFSKMWQDSRKFITIPLDSDITMSD